MSACPVQFYTKDVRCFLPQKRFDTEKRDMEVDLPSPPFFRKSTYIYIGQQGFRMTFWYKMGEIVSYTCKESQIKREKGKKIEKSVL